MINLQINYVPLQQVSANSRKRRLPYGKELVSAEAAGMIFDGI